MSPKKVYINTIGCQMNVHDSGRIADGLAPLGFRQTAFLDQADLVVVNTCAIRQKAEQKVFSFLGRLAGLKRRNPRMIIAVGGCVAQQEGERLFKRVPHLDIVFGTRAVNRLPEMVGKVQRKRYRLVDIRMEGDIDVSETTPAAGRGGGVTRFVTIMHGCDNFCAYCVVPYVRGRETSRHPDAILSEIETLVRGGVREVTLLGQNVNSYGQKEGLESFARLLDRINAVDGLKRIRFTTSHPKDLSDELMAAFRDLQKVAHHIHLPVQSGSNDILRRMNRKYTRERYLAMVDKMRKFCPGVAITSDIIVGFPGETRRDFEQTLALVREVEFDGLFAFQYSDRPNAAAAKYENKVDASVKKQRLQELFELQKSYTLKKNKALEGTVQEILVEGPSKKNTAPLGEMARTAPESAIGDLRSGGGQWTGRTSSNKIVNFNPSQDADSGVLPGRMVTILINTAFLHSLRGRIVNGGAPS